jgi:hypothetical protein
MRLASTVANSQWLTRPTTVILPARKALAGAVLPHTSDGTTIHVATSHCGIQHSGCVGNVWSVVGAVVALLTLQLSSALFIVCSAVTALCVCKAGQVLKDASSIWYKISSSGDRPFTQCYMFMHDADSTALKVVRIMLQPVTLSGILQRYACSLLALPGLSRIRLHDMQHTDLSQQTFPQLYHSACPAADSAATKAPFQLSNHCFHNIWPGQQAQQLLSSADIDQAIVQPVHLAGCFNSNKLLHR